MAKIELSIEQIEVLQKHFDGVYSPFLAPLEEQILMTEVIQKAEDLMEELQAYEESGEDLMRWFWNKYQGQK